MLGDGGSIQTQQFIQTSITSSGPLGDLLLGSPQGIAARVNAPSIIGNIDSTSGPISGVIETTSGDLGRTLTDASGKITGVTYVQANGGGLTGKIISRGNLVSSVRANGGLSGLIAAQGDIGAIQRKTDGSAVVGSDAANSLTRFGGVLVNGGMSGQIVALGNMFGDISINGGLTGRIAAHGRQGAGLHAQRFGILGNVDINGTIGATAAIVSLGVIGDDGVYVGTDSDTNGMHLTFSNGNGIIAAGGDVNFGKTNKINQPGLFENASGTNLAAVDAVFTQLGQQLAFDSSIGGKTGLELILSDLAALKVGTNGKLTGTTA
ncbi:MAG: hypothetical protein ACKV0T_30785 [Planctomycetales bacterium]